MDIQSEITSLDPEITFKTSHQHSTWAGTFRSFPEVYVQPRSISQLRHVLKAASRLRKRVCLTGCGHSPSDLTCTSKILINIDYLDKVLQVDGENVVTMEAGIRLRDLNAYLKTKGLAMPNLGSINDQSIAGAIATSTHGSSSFHGILSQNVLGLKIMLADGSITSCSKEQNLDLFRAALVSLGALGLVVEITFQAVPSFNIEWEQTLLPVNQILSDWNKDLWTAQEYTRWRASKTSRPADVPKFSGLGSKIGFHVYQFSLYITIYFPSLLPTVEKFVHILHYGSQGDGVTSRGVADGHTGLLMDCLYSQFVNEWAISLEKGPEAITRLSKWLNEEEGSGIPFSSKGMYVHAPIEVRVSDTSNYGPRPYLDFTYPDGPTLFLNATLYRPYHRDPPGWKRYYEGFEWLMKDLGGRPHWAKNFHTVERSDLQGMYPDLNEYLRIRQESDPEGLFVGDWHRRLLLDEEILPNEECVIKTEGAGGDVRWYGNTRRRVGHGISDKNLPLGDEEEERIRLIDDEV